MITYNLHVNGRRLLWNVYMYSRSELIVFYFIGIKRYTFFTPSSVQFGHCLKCICASAEYGNGLVLKFSYIKVDLWIKKRTISPNHIYGNGQFGFSALLLLIRQKHQQWYISDQTYFHPLRVEARWLLQKKWLLRKQRVLEIWRLGQWPNDCVAKSTQQKQPRVLASQIVYTDVRLPKTPLVCECAMI